MWWPGRRRGVKILEISTARIWGGGEVHLRALCFGLLARGHDVTVACRRGTPVHDALQDDGLPLVALPEKDDALALAREAARRRIDVLHAHQSKGARLAAAAHYLAGRPAAVLTKHTLGPPGEEVPRASLARVIAVSRAVARDCLAGGFTEAQVRVVPNGVDLRRFHPNVPAAPLSLLGLPPGARPVAIAGRLSREKGAYAALKAMFPLCAEFNLHFLVLGEGEDRDRLARLAQRRGREDRLHLLGRQADVRPYLAAAEVVVAPGPREAFGLAMLEAMAMGRAVVAMDAGGVPEVITDGRDGLLVPPDAGMALSAAVYRLLADGALRRRLGEAARDRAARYPIDLMASQTEDILAEAGRARDAVPRQIDPLHGRQGALEEERPNRAEALG